MILMLYYISFNIIIIFSKKYLLLFDIILNKNIQIYFNWNFLIIKIFNYIYKEINIKNYLINWERIKLF